jgi:hypothetical protein
VFVTAVSSGVICLLLASSWTRERQRLNRESYIAGMFPDDRPNDPRNSWVTLIHGPTGIGIQSTTGATQAANQERALDLLSERIGTAPFSVRDGIVQLDVWAVVRRALMGLNRPPADDAIPIWANVAGLIYGVIVTVAFGPLSRPLHVAVFFGFTLAFSYASFDRPSRLTTERDIVVTRVVMGVLALVAPFKPDAAAFLALLCLEHLAWRLWLRDALRPSPPLPPARTIGST